MPVDVQDLDCDFYVFTGHKLYGPTGIGVLYGKAALLDAMPPYQGGGDMIGSVTFEKTTYAALPAKFEAGTPAIVAGDRPRRRHRLRRSARPASASRAHEHDLLDLRDRSASPRSTGLRIVGTAPSKAAIISFTLDGVHAHDIGTILDREGVAVRAGHHCAQPLMERFGVAATARASFGLYNTREEVDALVAGARNGAGDFRLMLDDLRELYQEVILDHGKQPRNFRHPEHANRRGRMATTRCAATSSPSILEIDEDGRHRRTPPSRARAAPSRSPRPR